MSADRWPQGACWCFNTLLAVLIWALVLGVVL